ncbi:MAG TPA: 2-dehydropantoate 2-reductase [Verrucomicrobiae bacterium]|nr:2-dehydropantoate 2-reductase [Verrucomicrobiae bacterium]
MEICVYGAGSIGCYVGGRLAAGGARVVLIGRERLAADIRAHGLHLTDWLGADVRVAARDVRFETVPAAAASADLVLIAVKSAGTAQAGRELAGVLKPGALVVSFQNGLRNAEVLARELPGRTVLTGMVEFNVVNRGQGRFHHGSEGGLDVKDDAMLAPFLPAFTASGIPLRRHADMVPVMWAKLLLNLNNAINALCGIPLKQELSQRAFRRCIARAQRECLDLLDHERIVPARLTPLPPHWVPTMLGVPDAVFRALAGRMLQIDPLARSSMWEDLEAGRATEVDYLNGEVVKLAKSLDLTAPVNEKLTALVHAAEKGGRRDWTGPELLALLTAVR